MESAWKKATAAAPSIRVTDASTSDAGRVKVGGYAPNLPVVRPSPIDIRDGGKVRVGGYSPKL
jgi:hypothetical protein